MHSATEPSRAEHSWWSEPDFVGRLFPPIQGRLLRISVPWCSAWTRLLQPLVPRSTFSAPSLSALKAPPFLVETVFHLWGMSLKQHFGRLRQFCAFSKMSWKPQLRNRSRLTARREIHRVGSGEAWMGEQYVSEGERFSEWEATCSGRSQVTGFFYWGDDGASYAQCTSTTQLRRLLRWSLAVYWCSGLSVESMRLE